jgi:hypothetical protein
MELSNAIFQAELGYLSENWYKIFSDVNLQNGNSLLLIDVDAPIAQKHILKCLKNRINIWV